jgi:hypothetical protein
LERGLKPLPDGCLGIIIKINLTTNYQLLLNCNKVHRADSDVCKRGTGVNKKCTTKEPSRYASDVFLAIKGEPIEVVSCCCRMRTGQMFIRTW